MPQLFKGKVETSEGVVVPFHKRKHTQEAQAQPGPTPGRKKKQEKTKTAAGGEPEDKTTASQSKPAPASAPAPATPVDKSSKEFTGEDIAKHARAAMKEKTTFTFGFSVAAEEEEEEGHAHARGDDQGQDASAIATASEDSRTIYVGGLPYEIQDVEIEQYFSEYGQVERIDKLTFSDSGRFNGIAFVTFDSARSAKKALQANGQAAFAEDRYLVVRKYSRPNGREAAMKRLQQQQQTPIERRKGYHRIYVGNLPWNCTADLLREFFEYHFAHWDQTGEEEGQQQQQQQQQGEGQTEETKAENDEAKNGSTSKGKSCIKFLRMGTDKEGNFKGFAHLHFASEEDVDRALQLNGEFIEGRQIKISPAVPPKK